MRNRGAVWAVIGLGALDFFSLSFLGWRGMLGAVGGIVLTTLSITGIMLAEPVTENTEQMPVKWEYLYEDGDDDE
jgi:hypothetical protein